MKAEYKLESIENHIISEAIRFYHIMKLNEEAWKKSANEKDKQEFMNGIEVFRARWCVLLDLIEQLKIEDKYYDKLMKEEWFNESI